MSGVFCFRGRKQGDTEIGWEVLGMQANLIRSSERSRGGEQDQEVEGAVSLTQDPLCFAAGTQAP